MSIEEQEKLVKYWEHTIDGVKWSDEDRQLTIDTLTESNQTYDWWMETLINVPPDINGRYRKIIGMLREHRLISQDAHDTELETMEQWSSAALTRRGKTFADWYRQEEKVDFPCPIY
jgi:hypothetical protein